MQRQTDNSMWLMCVQGFYLENLFQWKQCSPQLSPMWIQKFFCKEKEQNNFYAFSAML